MKKVVSILFMLLLCFPAYSHDESLTDRQTEQKSKKIEIYFDLNSYTIDLEYMNNGESIQMLFDLINTHSADSNTEIIEVVLSSYSSPIGGLTVNKALTQKRTETIYQYLIDKCSVPASLISVKNYGVAWDMMREYVVESDMLYKTEIVDIIDNVPVETWARVEPTDTWKSLVDSRNKRLMEFSHGDPYRQMQKSIFPYLRKSSIEIRYVRSEPEIVCDSVVNVVPDLIPEVEEEIIIEPSNEVAQELVMAKKEKLPRNPILVVKTNLVGLAAGVANIAIEVPFKRHISIDGSAYYSPYTIDNEWRIRLAMLQSEVRYWLSVPLSGHFFGLHAHVGLFNISTNQWSRYQNSTNQPLWGLGLSYGYSLYLSRALSLEFNIGAGYASLSYDTFYNVENGANYRYTKRDYWGVTRAGISFNYIINRK